MDANVMGEQLNALVPFNRTVGIEVTEVGSGRAVARLAESPARLNHVGTMHAGALFTLADAASGAVVVGMFMAQLGQLLLVVRDAEIAFVKPARGAITAIAGTTETADAISARVDADGRTDTVVAVSLVDGAGVEVARVRMRWNIRRT